MAEQELAAAQACAAASAAAKAATASQAAVRRSQLEARQEAAQAEKVAARAKKQALLAALAPAEEVELRNKYVAQVLADGSAWWTAEQKGNQAGQAAALAEAIAQYDAWLVDQQRLRGQEVELGTPISPLETGQLAVPEQAQELAGLRVRLLHQVAELEQRIQGLLHRPALEQAMREGKLAAPDVHDLLMAAGWSARVSARHGERDAQILEAAGRAVPAARI